MSLDSSASIIEIKWSIKILTMEGSSEIASGNLLKNKRSNEFS
jgi:hypothetical protein